MLLPPAVPITEQTDLKSIGFATSALIDTGASCSCISEHAAKKLNLVPSGQIPVTSVHDTKNSNLYMASILVQMGLFLPDKDVMGISLPENSTYHVLIGMDIISRGALYVSFGSGGTCTFCI